MKQISVISLCIGIFYTGGAFCVDLPAVPFPTATPQQNTSDIPLDFVEFPKSDNVTVPMDVVPFPEPKESLLKATQFPKTIQDLSFKSRMELLADGYTPYEIVYENGVCVSGCAYPGITIQEDMDSVDEATEEMADLIEQQQDYDDEIISPATDWCHNGLSTKLPLRYPVDMSAFKWKITSDFGFRPKSANGARFHPAIDIACPVGTPVYATADGTVIWVDNQTTSGGAGKYIGIKHDNGLITMYLHLSKQLVSVNQRVSACQQIALSGVSGNDINGKPYTGPHLDYRIRFESDKNKFVDILCPCKASTKVGQGESSDYDLSCAHSLFYAPYKFVPYNPNSDVTKRSVWRVSHGHCMTKNTDLLPDEVK